MKVEAIRKLVREARKHATFETCIIRQEMSEEQRHDLDIFLNSWVLPYLDQALKLLDGEEIPLADRVYDLLP